MPKQHNPCNALNSCRIHAADVLRNLYVILTHGAVLQSTFPSKDGQDSAFLIAAISAIIHDYDHKGVNVRADILLHVKSMHQGIVQAPFFTAKPCVNATHRALHPIPASN